MLVKWIREGETDANVHLQAFAHRSQFRSNGLKIESLVCQLPPAFVHHHANAVHAVLVQSWHWWPEQRDSKKNTRKLEGKEKSFIFRNHFFHSPSREVILLMCTIPEWLRRWSIVFDHSLQNVSRADRHQTKRSLTAVNSVEQNTEAVNVTFLSSN